MNMRARYHQYSFHPRRRLIGRLYWLLCLTLLVLVIGYFLISSMLGPLVKRELESRLGGAVYLDSVRWVSPGGIRISNLVIAESDEELTDYPIARVRRANCRLSLLDLLRLKVTMGAITLQDAQLLFEYDFDRGCWNFSDLQFVRGQGSGSRIPIVYLKQGRVQIQVRRDRQVEHLTTIGLNGQFVSYRRGREYQFELTADEKMGLAGSRLRGIWRRGQDEGQIVMDGQIQMPHTRIFGNAWTVRDIHLDCNYYPKKLEFNELRFAMGAGRASLSGTFLEQPAEPEPEDESISELKRTVIREMERSRNPFTFDLNILLENFAFSPSFKPNIIVYSQSLMKLLDPGLVVFLKRFEPVGRGDLRVRLSGDSASLRESRAEGYFNCIDVTIIDQFMPYALEHLEGKILIENSGLLFDGITAEHGQASFVIHGGLDCTEAGMKLRSLVSGNNLALDQDLYASLPDSYKRLWFAFAPSGAGNIQYEYAGGGETPGKRTLQVDLIGANAAFDRFPYPLENLSGRLVIEPNGMEFVDLVSHYPDSRTITINGHLTDFRKSRPRFDFWIRADHVPVDETLYGALTKPQREIFEQFAVDGLLSMQLRVFDTELPGKEAEYTGSLRLAADSMEWTPLPLPLKDVILDADVRTDQLTLSMSQAACGDGQVAINSTIDFSKDPEKPTAEGSIRARRLPLSDTLWDAIYERYEVPDSIASVRADGSVDLDGDFAFNGADGNRLLITATCGGNRLYTTDRLWSSGPISGAVRFDGTAIEADHLFIPTIPVDSRFAALLPASAAGVLSDLKASGRLNVTINEGRFEPKPDGQFTLWAEGSAGLKDVQLSRLFVTGVYGLIPGQIEYDSRKGFCGGSGSFQMQQVKFLNRPIVDLSGPWVIDPNSRHTAISSMTARCCEGRIYGHASADFGNADSPGRYELHSSFNQIQIQPLVNAGRLWGEENRDAEGLLQGMLSLSGPLGDMNQSTGSLEVRATELKMESETLLGRALSLMQLQKQTDYVFDQMSLKADLQDGVFTSPRVLLEGVNSVFQGKGKVDLNKQSIQMTLTAFGRRAGQEPTLLNTLAESLGAAIARVEVTGALDNPEIRKIPLPLIQMPFELLGEPADK